MTTPDNDTKSTPPEPPTLRQNAVPLKLHQLHSRQQDALLSAIQVIRSYAQEACKTIKDDDIHPDLQVGKLANVLFIDGARGSGKSSILLSLIQSTYSEKGKVWFLPENKSDPCYKAITALHKDTDIQWLKPLDLELLPDESNLLAAILVRLEDVFKQVTPDKSQGTHEYLLYPKNDKSPLDRFNKLMNDVSLGWDSQLMSRRASDPDSYSQELRRTEQARFNIRNFNTILTDLADLYKTQSKHNKTPLFILPVDDADLNPTRYAELFKLIRMLPARNLFFVISGNYDNFKDLFEFGFLADFQKLTQGFEANKDYPHKRVMALASQLGYAARRKNLPGGIHRIQVQPFTRWEAANFAPHALLGFESEKSKWTLKKLLCKIKLPEPGEPQYRDYLAPAKNLWEVITLSQEYEEEGKETEHSSTYWPQTADIIAGPPRAVFDLWLDLFQIYERYYPERSEHYTPSPDESSEKLNAIISFVEHAYQECIDAEASIPYEVKEILKGLFKFKGGRAFHSRVEQRVRVEQIGLPRVFEYPSLSEFSRPTDMPNHMEQFKVCKLAKVALAVSYEENGASQTYYVDDFRAGWAFLLNDLMLLKPGNAFSRLDLSLVCKGLMNSTANADNEVPILYWPTPDWLSCYDLFFFTQSWNRYVDEMLKSEANVSISKISKEWVMLSIQTALYKSTHFKHTLTSEKKIVFDFINLLAQKKTSLSPHKKRLSKRILLCSNGLFDDIFGLESKMNPIFNLTPKNTLIKRNMEKLSKIIDENRDEILEMKARTIISFELLSKQNTPDKDIEYWIESWQSRIPIRVNDIAEHDEHDVTEHSEHYDAEHHEYYDYSNEEYTPPELIQHCLQLFEQLKKQKQETYKN
jgi:hypothetical protein